MDEGNEIVNLVKQKAEDFISNGSKKIASAILTSPIFYAVIGIFLVICIISGAFITVDASTINNSDGMSNVNNESGGSSSGSSGSGGLSANSGDIIEAAKNLHDQQTSWSYSITTLTWGDINKAINSPYKTTCCATYVSSILYVAGYVTEAEINGINYNSSNALRNLLKSKNWQEITSYNNLQAGDVVFMDTDGGSWDITHVQMCGAVDNGNYYWFNAGGNKSIQREYSPYLDNGCSKGFYIAYRPTK